MLTKFVSESLRVILTKDIQEINALMLLQMLFALQMAPYLVM